MNAFDFSDTCELILLLEKLVWNKNEAYKRRKLLVLFKDTFGYVQDQYQFPNLTILYLKIGI